MVGRRRRAGERLGRLAAAVAVALAFAGAARAGVERVDILERSSFAGGASFGPAGAYEEIRGVAHFALDPEAAANTAVADLKLAPRDARSRVLFDSGRPRAKVGLRARC